MQNLHSYRDRKVKFETNRLVFDNETPDDIAKKAFEGQEVDEKSPNKINVDQLKQAAIDKLNRIPKDKRTQKEYDAAKGKIEAAATALKAKQNYFKEKTALGEKVSKPYPAFKDVKGYEAAKADAAKFGSIGKLQTDAGISDKVDYAAKKAEAEKAMTDYTDKIKAEMKSARDAVNLIMNPKEDEVVSDEQKSMLKKQIAALDALNRTYLVIKGKNSGAFDSAAEEVYKDSFNLVNLWAARDAKRGIGADTKADDKKNIEGWAAGAEMLNKLRVAKGGANASWDKLVNAGDAAEVIRKQLEQPTNPAQMAWAAAKKVEQTDYATAAKKYTEAGNLYLEAFNSFNNEKGATDALAKVSVLLDDPANKDYREEMKKVSDPLVKEGDAEKGKGNFGEAKAKYEKAYTDAKAKLDYLSLSTDKTDADIKKATDDMNAKKGEFDKQTYSAGDKAIVDGLANKLLITGVDKAVIFTNLRERTRIYTEAIGAMTSYNKAMEVKNKSPYGGSAQGVDDIIADGNWSFNRGDFGRAAKMYENAAKLNSYAFSHWDSYSTYMIDDKGEVVQNFTGRDENMEKLFNEKENLAKQARAKVVGDPVVEAQLKTHFDRTTAFNTDGTTKRALKIQEFKEIVSIVDRALAAKQFKTSEITSAQASPAVKELVKTGDQYYSDGSFEAAKQYYQSASELYKKEKTGNLIAGK